MPSSSCDCSLDADAAKQVDTGRQTSVIVLNWADGHLDSPAESKTFHEDALPSIRISTSPSCAWPASPSDAARTSPETGLHGEEATLQAAAQRLLRQLDDCEARVSMYATAGRGIVRSDELMAGWVEHEKSASGSQTCREELVVAGTHECDGTCTFDAKAHNDFGMASKSIIDQGVSPSGDPLRSAEGIPGSDPSSDCAASVSADASATGSFDILGSTTPGTVGRVTSRFDGRGEVGATVSTGSPQSASLCSDCGSSCGSDGVDTPSAGVGVDAPPTDGVRAGAGRPRGGAQTAFSAQGACEGRSGGKTGREVRSRREGLRAGAQGSRGGGTATVDARQDCVHQMDGLCCAIGDFVDKHDSLDGARGCGCVHQMESAVAAASMEVRRPCARTRASQAGVATRLQRGWLEAQRKRRAQADSNESARDLAEMHELRFSPMINEMSVDLLRERRESDVAARLHEMGRTAKERQEVAKRAAEVAARSESRPKICVESQRLAAARQERDGATVQERLYAHACARATQRSSASAAFSDDGDGNLAHVPCINAASRRLAAGREDASAPVHERLYARQLLRSSTSDLHSSSVSDSTYAPQLDSRSELLVSQRGDRHLPVECRLIAQHVASQERRASAIVSDLRAPQINARSEALLRRRGPALPFEQRLTMRARRGRSDEVSAAGAKGQSAGERAGLDRRREGNGRSSGCAVEGARETGDDARDTEGGSTGRVAHKAGGSELEECTHAPRLSPGTLQLLRQRGQAESCAQAGNGSALRAATPEGATVRVPVHERLLAWREQRPRPPEPVGLADRKWQFGPEACGTPCGAESPAPHARRAAGRARRASAGCAVRRKPPAPCSTAAAAAAAVAATATAAPASLSARTSESASVAAPRTRRAASLCANGGATSSPTLLPLPSPRPSRGPNGALVHSQRVAAENRPSQTASTTTAPIRAPREQAFERSMGSSAGGASHSCERAREAISTLAESSGHDDDDRGLHALTVGGSPQAPSAARQESPVPMASRQRRRSGLPAPGSPQLQRALAKSKRANGAIAACSNTEMRAACTPADVAGLGCSEPAQDSVSARSRAVRPRRSSLAPSPISALRGSQIPTADSKIKQYKADVEGTTAPQQQPQQPQQPRLSAPTAATSLPPPISSSAPSSIPDAGPGIAQPEALRRSLSDMHDRASHDDSLLAAKAQSADADTAAAQDSEWPSLSNEASRSAAYPCSSEIVGEEGGSFSDRDDEDRAGETRQFGLASSRADLRFSLCSSHAGSAVRKQDVCSSVDGLLRSLAPNLGSCVSEGIVRNAAPRRLKCSLQMYPQRDETPGDAGGRSAEPRQSSSCTSLRAGLAGDVLDRVQAGAPATFSAHSALCGERQAEAAFAAAAPQHRDGCWSGSCFRVDKGSDFRHARGGSHGSGYSDGGSSEDGEDGDGSERSEGGEKSEDAAACGVENEVGEPDCAAFDAAGMPVGSFGEGVSLRASLDRTQVRARPLCELLGGEAQRRPRAASPHENATGGGRDDGRPRRGRGEEGCGAGAGAGGGSGSDDSGECNDDGVNSRCGDASLARGCCPCESGADQLHFGSGESRTHAEERADASCSVRKMRLPSFDSSRIAQEDCPRAGSPVLREMRGQGDGPAGRDEQCASERARHASATLGETVEERDGDADAAHAGSRLPAQSRLVMGSEEDVLVARDGRDGREAALADHSKHMARALPRNRANRQAADAYSATCANIDAIPTVVNGAQDTGAAARASEVALRSELAEVKRQLQRSQASRSELQAIALASRDELKRLQLQVEAGEKQTAQHLGTLLARLRTAEEDLQTQRDRASTAELALREAEVARLDLQVEAERARAAAVENAQTAVDLKSASGIAASLAVEVAAVTLRSELERCDSEQDALRALLQQVRFRDAEGQCSLKRKLPEGGSKTCTEADRRRYRKDEEKQESSRAGNRDCGCKDPSRAVGEDWHTELCEAKAEVLRLRVELEMTKQEQLGAAMRARRLERELASIRWRSVDARLIQD